MIKNKTNNIISLTNSVREIARTQSICETHLYDEVIDALKKAYQKEINPENELMIQKQEQDGEFALFEMKTAVQKVNNANLEIEVKIAKKINSEIKPGEKIMIPFNLHRFSRFAIQQISQSMKHAINVAESEKIYQKFIQKKGTILSGPIENIEHRYFSIDIGGIHAFVPKEEQIPYKKNILGERVKILVKEVYHNHSFGQVEGTRRDNAFLTALLKLEVPEVNNDLIEIVKVEREPGVRAKVAVLSNDSTIDPIGTCIGRGGNRINAITNELKGEKIDIFLWDENPRTFMINACTPSKVINLELNEKTKKAKILVLDDQYSIAIGRYGSAIRLLSKITGYEIELSSLERVADKLDKVELNGNLSMFDLKKLEISPNILNKCYSPKTEDDD